MTDFGPSVPDEQKALIFERFYRGEASRTGKAHFGLGLAIAKEIISLHRGKLWVENAHKNCEALFFAGLRNFFLLYDA